MKTTGSPLLILSFAKLFKMINNLYRMSMKEVNLNQAIHQMLIQMRDFWHQVKDSDLLTFSKSTLKLNNNKSRQSRLINCKILNRSQIIYWQGVMLRWTIAAKIWMLQEISLTWVVGISIEHRQISWQTNQQLQILWEEQSKFHSHIYLDKRQFKRVYLSSSSIKTSVVSMGFQYSEKIIAEVSQTCGLP